MLTKKKKRHSNKIESCGSAAVKTGKGRIMSPLQVGGAGALAWARAVKIPTIDKTSIPTNKYQQYQPRGGGYDTNTRKVAGIWLVCNSTKYGSYILAYQRPKIGGNLNSLFVRRFSPSTKQCWNSFLSNHLVITSDWIDCLVDAKQMTLYR